MIIDDKGDCTHQYELNYRGQLIVKLKTQTHRNFHKGQQIKLNSNQTQSHSFCPSISNDQVNSIPSIFQDFHETKNGILDIKKFSDSKNVVFYDELFDFSKIDQ